LTAANIIPQLEDLGPFTVFAPTDEAFTLMGPALALSLLQPENKEALLQFVQYHLAYTMYKSDEMELGTKITTLLAGHDVEVTSLVPTRLNVYARLSSPNQPATNGVVHIIDQVLVPSGFEFPAPEFNLVQLPGQADYLSFFRRALSAAGAESTLTQDGQDFTVFAPTDEAFEAMGPGVATSLLLVANRAKLRTLLFYHVLLGRQKSTTLQPAQNLRSMEGAELQVTMITPHLKLNSGATLISRDVPATNGLLNVVNKVMVPPEYLYPDQTIASIVSRSPDLSFMYEALQAADMLESMSEQGPVTLLAPTNAAWESLGMGYARTLLLPSSRSRLVQILRYHVLVGTKRSSAVSTGDLVQTLAMGTLQIRSVSPFMVDTARSSTQDVPCTDGIAHIVDKVLMPEKFVFPERDAWGLLMAEPSLMRFRNALANNGLDHYLASDPAASAGPVTIFAPTDAAFEALGDFTLDTLFDRPNELLPLLKYHIVQHQVDSTMLTYSSEISTLEGRKIDVTPWTDQGWLGVVHDRFTDPPTVNKEAKLILPDCLVTNGMVHIIDKVLMPTGYDPPVSTTKWRYTTDSSPRGAIFGMVVGNSPIQKI